MTEENITILVPTKNRSKYIFALLEYYQNNNSKVKILIGDSSSGFDLEKNNESINFFSKDLDITWYSCPNLDVRKTLTLLASRVKTRYCVFSGDDDFFIPSALAESARILDHDSSYDGIQGIGISIDLDAKSEYQVVNSTGLYCTPKTINHKRPIDRINFFAENYFITQFSVQRIEVFRQGIKGFCEISDNAWGEIYHSFSIVLAGKTFFLPRLYLVRGMHCNRTKKYGHDEHMSWLNNLDFDRNKTILIDYINLNIQPEKFSHFNNPGKYIVEKFINLMTVKKLKKIDNPAFGWKIFTSFGIARYLINIVKSRFFKNSITYRLNNKNSLLCSDYKFFLSKRPNLLK